MRPLHCVTHTITLSNVPQSILDILIPANTWAQYKRMLLRADVQMLRHAPIPVGNTSYIEGYNMSGIGPVQRGPVSLIAAGSLHTEYQIARDFILDEALQAFESNFDTVGVATLAQVQGQFHFIRVTNVVGLFDPTVDNVLSLTVYNTDPTTADTISVGTAQAYIQAPLNLNRLPQ